LLRTVCRDTASRVLALLLVLSAVVAAQARQAHSQAAAMPTPTSTRNAWDGVYTVAQAERGWGAYRRSCGHCHRDNLLGDDGPPLYGVDFTYRWDNHTVAEMFDVIASTMPPVSAALPSLTPQEYADVISFIFRSNGLPAGAAELRPDPEALKQVLFTLRPPGGSSRSHGVPRVQMGLTGRSLLATLRR